MAWGEKTGAERQAEWVFLVFLGITAAGLSGWEQEIIWDPGKIDGQDRTGQ